MIEIISIKVIWCLLALFLVLNRPLSFPSSTIFLSSPPNSSLLTHNSSLPALDFIEKKLGGSRFSDPNNAKNRAMNEKITDGIRKVFEKLTG